MTRMLGGRRGLAAFAVSFAFMAVFLLPMVAAVMSAADHASSVLHWIDTVEAHGLPGPPPDVVGWPLVGPHLHDAWARLSTEGGEAFARNQTEIRTAVEWLLTQGGSLGLGLLQFALAIVITGLFLSNASPAVGLARSFAENVGGAEALQLLPLAARTIRAVSFGIVGTALAEAVLATIGYALAGVPMAVLLGFVTFLSCMLQIGPLLIALPTAIWLWSTGEVGWAIFVALWNVLMVNSIDNFAKPYFVSKGTHLPISLVFAGVLGGMIAWGFVGTFLGATILAVGYTLLLSWLGKGPGAPADAVGRAEATQDEGRSP